MQFEKSPSTSLTYKQVAEKAFIASDTLLDEIRLLKPHMLEVSKNLLQTAPVSLYLYLQTLKSANPSTAHSTPTASETKIQLPKKHPIIFEEEEEHNSLLLSALDRS